MRAKSRAESRDKKLLEILSCFSGININYVDPQRGAFLAFLRSFSETSDCQCETNSRGEALKNHLFARREREKSFSLLFLHFSSQLGRPRRGLAKLSKNRAAHSRLFPARRGEVEVDSAGSCFHLSPRYFLSFVVASAPEIKGRIASCFDVLPKLN